MSNARLYGFWGSLTEALQTGKPQNEGKTGGNIFAAIYANPERLRSFASAMTGISAGAARAIAEKFPGRTTKPSLISVQRKVGCRCESLRHTRT
jgi:hypothetical protein